MGLNYSSYNYVILIIHFNIISSSSTSASILTIMAPDLCSKVQVERRRRRPYSIRPPGLQRKVRILIPNSESTMGMERALRDTAHYILALQIRVEVMKIMLHLLLLLIIINTTPYLHTLDLHSFFFIFICFN